MGDIQMLDRIVALETKMDRVFQIIDELKEGNRMHSEKTDDLRILITELGIHTSNLVEASRLQCERLRKMEEEGHKFKGMWVVGVAAAGIVWYLLKDHIKIMFM